MSIATEILSGHGVRVIKKAEQDVRVIAKEHGAKVRRNPISGIDVTFQDGKKKRYNGWLHIQNEFVKVFDLAD